jgi:phosphoenolpyruvate phosphomutase
MKKKIYVPMGADIIHEAHLNIIKRAKHYGDIIIGLFSDKAISEYKRLPLISYEQRYSMMEKIKGIMMIVKQDSWDYSENLKKIKPDYLIHGDDWKNSIQKEMRKKVIKIMSSWNGKVIEVPYSRNISKQTIKNIKNSFFFSSENRVSRLKRLLNSKPIVRLIECHSPLVGMVIESLKLERKNEFREFDGLWSSSLTDSLLFAKEDNQSLDLSARIQNLNYTLESTSKPILMDVDNGGRNEHLDNLIKNLERLGVSGIMMEDKVGEKINSLSANQSQSSQDSILNFCKKIKIATNARRLNDFMIGARIESLILNKGMEDALKRADAYSKAGADLILIHSKKNTADEIIDFCKKFKKSNFFKPVVVVPSTYPQIKEQELIKYGVKIVIYANQLMRASYNAIKQSAISILESQKASQLENKITSIKEIISIIPKVK